MVLTSAQIIACLVRILNRVGVGVLLDGHRLLFLLHCILFMKQIAKLGIHVMPDLFHRSILLQLYTVANSKLSTL